MGDHARDAKTGGAGDRLTITVGEAADRLGISRTSAYKCATTGEIPTVRLGRRVLVPLAPLMAMLERPPADDQPETDSDEV